MKKITLHKLKCRKTEDYRTDECRLDIYVDGELKPPKKKNMRKRRTWRINKSYNYKNQVRIKLYDEDWPDADDLLGQVNIVPNDVTNATKRFNRDGADYKLFYSVVDVPDVDLVQVELEKFRASTLSSRWSYVNKDALLTDIADKISNPLHVNQGNTPLCGPAAIVYELVAKQPVRYIKICKRLFEKGKLLGKTKTYTPSLTLLRSRVPRRDRISIADWLLMASLRDVGNALFDVSSSSNDFVMGLTTPNEMKEWTSEILGYNTIHWESTYVFGEFEAMKHASRVRNKGGVAFILCHSEMVGGSSDRFTLPNHWISYTDGLKIDDGVWYRHDDGRIEFNAYTWGRIESVNLDEGKFEDCMFGVVTGYA